MEAAKNTHLKRKIIWTKTCILGVPLVCFRGCPVERLLGAGSAQGCLTGCNFCFILLLLVLWCFCFHGKLCVCELVLVFFLAHPPGVVITHDIWICFDYCAMFSLQCNVRPVMFFQVAESLATPNPCRQWKTLPLALPNCTGASGWMLARNWVVGPPTWNPKPIFGDF